MAPSLHVLAREASVIRSRAREALDIRQHLGTKVPYAHRLIVPGAPSLHDVPDPDGYKPVHMYLLSRHGTRWPTQPRAEQMSELQRILRHAKSSEHAWARNWTSPFTDVPYVFGELHPVGEEELWSLADRLRARFPGILTAPYFPKRYPVISTHVSRAAQSASAFAMAFFPGPQDSLNAGHEQQQQEAGMHQAAGVQNMHRKLKASSVGRKPAQAAAGGVAHRPTRPQAFALKMAPTKHDPVLRFFDACPAYKQHVDQTERWLAPWTMGIWSQMAPRISARLGLPDAHTFNACDVDALWQLCSFEYGLLGQRDGACTAFSAQEARLLEWLEDVRLWEVQGYGAAINYEIASPLLADIVRSLKDAAAAPEQPLQLARLMFAHCETITPLATLLGLFKPGPEEASAMPTLPKLTESLVSASEAEADLAAVDAEEDVQLELAKKGKLKHICQGKYRGKKALGSDDSQLLELPPDWKPAFAEDASRTWRSGRISPLGANLVLVLYRREDSSSTGGTGVTGPRHRVRLAYNEQVLRLPGCSEDDCDLEEFLRVLTAGGKANVARFKQLCGASSANELLGGGLLKAPDGLPLEGWSEQPLQHGGERKAWLAGAGMNQAAAAS